MRWLRTLGSTAASMAIGAALAFGGLGLGIVGVAQYVSLDAPISGWEVLFWFASGTAMAFAGVWLAFLRHLLSGTAAVPAGSVLLSIGFLALGLLLDPGTKTHEGFVLFFVIAAIFLPWGVWVLRSGARSKRAAGSLAGAAKALGLVMDRVRWFRPVTARGSVEQRPVSIRASGNDVTVEVGGFHRDHEILPEAGRLVAMLRAEENVRTGDKLLDDTAYLRDLSDSRGVFAAALNAETRAKVLEAVRAGVRVEIHGGTARVSRDASPAGRLTASTTLHEELVALTRLCVDLAKRLEPAGEPARSLARIVAEDPNPDVRVAALETACAMFPKSPEIWRACENAVISDDRALAVTAACQILTRQSRFSDGATVAAAVSVLAEGPDPRGELVLLKALEKWLASDETLARIAIDALASSGGAAALAALEPILGTYKLNALQSSAAEAIAKIRARLASSAGQLTVAQPNPGQGAISVASSDAGALSDAAPARSRGEKEPA